MLIQLHGKAGRGELRQGAGSKERAGGQTMTKGGREGALVVVVLEILVTASPCLTRFVFISSVNRLLIASGRCDEIFSLISDERNKRLCGET